MFDFLLRINSILQIVFVFINTLLIIGIFLIFAKVWLMRPKFTFDYKLRKRILTLEKSVFEKHWRSVLQKINGQTPLSLKLAIIEADKLADDALKNMGFRGEHMADRLGQIQPEDLKSLERLWRAHRLRNDLVHTPGFQISLEEAKSAIEDYREFFKEIEMAQ